MTIHKTLGRIPYKMLAAILSPFYKVQYNRVVLAANRARGYMCNPKYLAEKLEELYPGYFDLILLTKGDTGDVPNYVRCIRPRGREAIRALASARFWVDNCRYPKLVPKKRNQIYIQLWHGLLGSKKIEKAAGDALPKSYQKGAARDSGMIDLMFVDNDIQESIYKNDFWYDGPVLRCEMPRSAPLRSYNKSDVERIKRRIGISKDAKLCLYAPTFRKDYSVDKYNVDVCKVLEALEKRFGGQFVFAYRLHPNVADRADETQFADRLNLSLYDDTQELLVAADVLISDYSSILEDFALTYKPGFIYAPDLEEYMNDRGFAFDIRKRPYAFTTNNDELVDAILAYDNSHSNELHDEFFRYIGYDTCGRDAGFIAQIMKELTVPGSTVEDVI